MFRCLNCRLATYSTAQVTPYISKDMMQESQPGLSASTDDDDLIYFIVSHPLTVDINTQIAYSGGEGNFLRVFLQRQNITNYRIFTLTRCIPYKAEYPEIISAEPLPPPIQNIRNPFPDEIKCCQQYLLRDIVRHKPKVLVPMGVQALRWLMKDDSLEMKSSRGKVFYKTIMDTEYTVIPTYDAGFVADNSNNMDLAEKFDNDIEKIKHISDGTWEDVTTANNLTFATDYPTFKQYYLENLAGEEELAYDIETNAAMVFDKRFDIIGFSLAKKRYGIYVSLKALDKEMSPREILQCKTLLRVILKNTKKVYVHNCLYERPATYYNLGYDFPFEQIEDTLVMAKLMLGGKIGAGLKPNAQRIGYPDWETDLTEYLSYLNAVSGGKAGMHALVKYKPFYDIMRLHITLQDFCDGLKAAYSYLAEKFPEAILYIPMATLPEPGSMEYDNFVERFPNIKDIIPKKMLDKDDPAFQAVVDRLPKDMQAIVRGKMTAEQKSKLQAYLKETPGAKLLIDFGKKMAPHASASTKILDMIRVSDGMKELIRKYYKDEKEADHLLHLISDIMIEYLDNGIPGDVPPYNWIPWRIITLYGATDALATVDLRDYYLDRFKKESTAEVDLYQGYKYALMEHYVGHCLMMAGIKWDDVSATRDRNKYISILGKTIGFLFTSPKVIDYIVREKWGTYIPAVIYEYYNDYMWSFCRQRVGVAASKDGVDTFKTVYIDPKSGKEKQKHIRHILTDQNGNAIQLDQSIMKDILEKCSEMVLKEIKEIPTDEYERLKSDYFNPMAMDASLPVLVNDILVTEEVHIGRFILECEKLYASEDFKIQSKTGIRGYSKLYDEYMKKLFDRDFPNAGSNIVERAEKYKEFVKLHRKVEESEYSQQYFLDNFVRDSVFWKAFDTFESSKDMDVKKKAYDEIADFYKEAVKSSIDGIKEFLYWEKNKQKNTNPFRKETRNVSFITYFVSDDLKNAFLDAYLFHISGLTDDDQIDIYNALIVDPALNPDKEETWSYEMRWLFNFRCFRKAYKMVGTYIDGSSGRENVYIVDKKKLSNGEDVVPRLEEYTKYVSGDVPDDVSLLKENNEVDYLEQVVFGVGTAETGRWRSGIHTLPAASTLKKLYSSRFRGGTILMPDFSANEMRCVASYAQEDAMLKAFADGLDIHKANASSVFNVPYDQVTKAQRKFSKAVSFGILYGSSARSLADSYFHGNLSRAQDLLDKFYSTFPKLKEWIDGKHREVLETHKVSVLTNRFLSIDFDPLDKKSVAKALRQSQNFPVQSSASSVAAIVFCDIILFMRRNNMKSKPICFIHDSLESDVYPYEFFKLIEQQQYELANSALKMFNLALKADVAMGVNMGSECEMNKLEIMNEEKTEGKVTLEGYKTDIMDLVENWKTAYNLVEVVEEEWEEEVGQMELLFMKKKSFDPSIHAHRLKGTATIYIRYYNDKGEVEPMNPGEPDLYNIWSDFPLYDYMGVKEKKEEKK